MPLDYDLLKLRNSKLEGDQETLIRWMEQQPAFINNLVLMSLKRVFHLRRKYDLFVTKTIVQLKAEFSHDSETGLRKIFCKKQEM